MAMIKKSITITSRQNEDIQSVMAAGLYDSDSELFRDALREKLARIARDEAIRNKLIASENSGFTRQSMKDIKAEFEERARKDAKL